MKQISAATKNMMGMCMYTMCMFGHACFSDVLSPYRLPSCGSK
ncbi:MAG: hypothetical protein ACLU8W_12200 [Clostridia bacterium]